MLHFEYLTYASRTDVGRMRTNNEDSYGEFPESGVFCVSDGMGGGDDGEVASKATVEAIGDFCQGNALPVDATYRIDDMIEGLRRAVNKASYWINNHANEHHLRGCGATFVGICFDAANPAEAMALHAGDSRLYRIRGRGIQQITKDHSAAALIGAKDDKDVNPMFRGMILRAVGISPTVDVDATPVSVKARDKILICSDGLSRMVPDKRILSIVRTSSSLKAAVDDLIAAANEAGGVDNITAVLVEVGDLPLPMEARPLSLPPKEGDDNQPDTAPCGETANTCDTAIEITDDTTENNAEKTGGEPKSQKSGDTEELFVASSSPRRRKAFSFMAGFIAVAALVAVVYSVNRGAAEDDGKDAPASVDEVKPQRPLAPKPAKQDSPKMVSPETSKPARQEVSKKDEIPDRARVLEQNAFLAACTNLLEQIEPIENRQARLERLMQNVKDAAATNVISQAQAEALEKAIDERKHLIVWKIANNTSDSISFMGKLIPTNLVETFVFTNNLPENCTISREYYEDKTLDAVFDGRVISLSDSDFKPCAVRILLPKRGEVIGKDVRCFIGDKLVEGEIWAVPGQELVCTFRKEDGKLYEDQVRKYKVQFPDRQKLPQQFPPPNGKWVYRKKRIAAPKLPQGVTCWIGGQELKGEIKLQPEEKIRYVYRLEGHVPLTNECVVMPSEGVQVLKPPPPLEKWEPLPVRVIVPILSNGVTVCIDGEPETNEYRMCKPGKSHSCLYERRDYQKQKPITFEVKPGCDMHLPPPGKWLPSKSLAKLEEAEKAVMNGDLKRAQEALRGVAELESSEHKRRLTKVQEELKKALDERAAQIKKKYEESVGELLKVCSPEVVDCIVKTVQSSKLELHPEDVDIFRNISKIEIKKSVDSREAIEQKILPACRRMAEALHEVISLDLSMESVVTPAMKKNNEARNMADEFIRYFDVSDFEKSAETIHNCAVFLKSFYDANSDDADGQRD